MANRYPVIYKEGFLGSKTYDACDRIDVLVERASKDKTHGIERYYKSIYNISDEDVAQIIETRSTSGIHVRTGSLRPYQTYGVHFLLLAKNAILTDEVGLGKTAQVAALTNILDKAKFDRQKGAFRYIFVTGMGLIEQAQRELIKFTAKPVLISTGQKEDVKRLIEQIKEGNFSGIVCSYSILASFEFMSFLNHWVSQNGKLDYLFVDESSELRNKQTSTYKMLTRMRDMLTNHCILMNATPFEKDIYTLYSQLDFVDPTMLPSKTNFDKMFVNKNQLTGYINGYKNPEKFKSAIRYFVFGQTREELGIEMEKSTFELLTYDLTPVQRKMLSNTNYPTYVFENPNWIDEKLDFNLDNVPKAKVLIGLWKEKILPNKLVVYCKFKEAQYFLKSLFEDEGYDALILNGDDNTSKKKMEKVELFRSGDYDVLITNIQKGLNLEFVNHLVFYSFSNNSGMMNQVEGRIIRSQSILNKHVYLIVGRVKEYQVIAEAGKNSLHREKHTKTGVSLLSIFLKYASGIVKQSLDLKEDWMSHAICHIYNEKDDYVLDYEFDTSVMDYLDMEE